jgi:hypothetical protein
LLPLLYLRKYRFKKKLFGHGIKENKQQQGYHDAKTPVTAGSTVVEPTAAAPTTAKNTCIGKGATVPATAWTRAKA